MQEPAAPVEAPGAPRGQAGAQGAAEGVAGAPRVPPRPQAPRAAAAAAPPPLLAVGGLPPLPAAPGPVYYGGGGDPGFFQAAGGAAHPNFFPDQNNRSRTQQILCRYYLHGHCKEGDNCRFSHDLSGWRMAGAGPGWAPRAYPYAGPFAAAQSVPPQHVAAAPPPAQHVGAVAPPPAQHVAAVAPPPVQHVAAAAPPPVQHVAAAAPPPVQHVAAAALPPPCYWPLIGPAAEWGIYHPATDSAGFPAGYSAGYGAGHGAAGCNAGVGAAGYSAGYGAAGGAEGWAGAFEFVPGQPYRARMAPPHVPPAPRAEGAPVAVGRGTQLCRYAVRGHCLNGESCSYLHGDECDMCGLHALHPVDAAQREAHARFCLETHERDMELSFAVHRTLEKVCGICMEVVHEKTAPGNRRFGILPNCSHTFCLLCIRRWRSASQFENRITKSCPQCRVSSSFVIPSLFWVEDEQEKAQLIQEYKEGMSKKDCRYFAQGRGYCPFGAYCFYKHELPEGHDHRPSGGGGGGAAGVYWLQVVQPVPVARGNLLSRSSKKELAIERLANRLLKRFLALKYNLPISEWDLIYSQLEDCFDLNL